MEYTDRKKRVHRINERVKCTEDTRHTRRELIEALIRVFSDKNRGGYIGDCDLCKKKR